MYLNQKFIFNIPLIKATRIVCISKIIPIDKGWVKKIKVIENIKVIIIIIIQRIV